jgi:hypothetical protein
VTASAHHHNRSCQKQRCTTPRTPWSHVGAVLQAREPGNTAHEEEERDVEVEPQPEDVMSGIDP